MELGKFLNQTCTGARFRALEERMLDASCPWQERYSHGALLRRTICISDEQALFQPSSCRSAGRRALLFRLLRPVRRQAKKKMRNIVFRHEFDARAEIERCWRCAVCRTRRGLTRCSGQTGEGQEWCGRQGTRQTPRGGRARTVGERVTLFWTQRVGGCGS